MACDATNDEQLVFVQDSCMSSSTLGNDTRNLRLGPVCGFEVEHNEIGEVCPMLVLAAKDQKLITLIQGCSVSYKTT